MKKLLPFLISATALIATAEPAPSNHPWEVASSGKVSVAVPKDWRSFDGIQPAMVIYRQGDGIGVPMVDETGAPLQIGITVEKFPPSEDSIEVIAKKTSEGALRDPRMQIAADDIVEPLTLSDQTKAVYLTKQLIKSVHRRSLQMKLFTKDPEGNVWVVSGYIVGGKDSRTPTPKSPLALWLRAHLASATVTGKPIDSKPLQSAYRKPEPAQ
jgi:hypothetical protein